MLKSHILGCSVAACCIGLSACGGGGSSSSGGSTTGSFSLGITDATVDEVDRVLVEFTGVSVKPAEGSAIDLPLDGDSHQTCLDLLAGDGPGATPADKPTVRCIELKELQGTDTASLLQGVSLEAGKYNWLRLDVNAERGVMDSIIVVDGMEESLYVPSGSQSGLKLNTEFTILAGGSHNFVIDFDLRKSVNNPQGFADYRLKPSLRLIDMAESGTIFGTVDESLLVTSDPANEACNGDVNTGDGFAVYVYEGAAEITGDEGSGNAPLTSAAVNYSDDSGRWEYEVGFLAAPQEYTVVFTCQAAKDDNAEADEDIAFVTSTDSPVSVTVDGNAEVNFPGGI